MGDYLSEFTKEQVEFAQWKVRSIMGQVPGEVKIVLGGAKLAALTADVERNAVIVLQEYAHWLSQKLIRSQNFKKQPFPDSSEIIAHISKKFEIPPDFVTDFIIRVTWSSRGRVPLIGTVADDHHLIPNEPALRKYEACFDWGK